MYKKRHILTMSRDSHAVYTLALEGNHFYVGSTTDIDKRVAEHRRGDGSAWTRMYKPIGKNPIAAVAFDDPIRARLAEDSETVFLMLRHGKDKVRGGTYSSPDLDMSILEPVLRHAMDLCLRCGESGHYVEDCPDESNFSDVSSESSEESDASVCSRCGRDSHESRDCYAYTDVNGTRL